MLRIVIEGDELFNEETNEFSTVGDVVIDIEHSLVSLSKWESKFQRPFLGPGEKKSEEVLDYIRMMILTPDVPVDICNRLSTKNLEDINSYIESKQSATTFNELPQGRGRSEIITSELIYYWMVAYSIPLECEHWHLNRLFSLIRICNIKNASPKKMRKSEIAQRNRELNAQRRAQLGTAG